MKRLLRLQICALIVLVVINARVHAEPDPQDDLAWFNFGVQAQQNGDFATAVKAYDHVLELGSALAPVALYYEALISSSRQDVARAQALLSRIDVERLPENLRQRVLDLKTSLAVADFSAHSARHVSGYFELSYGSNDNPQTLAVLAENQVRADHEWQGKLNVSAPYVATANFDARVEYGFAGTYFRNTSYADFSYHDILLPFSYYFDFNRVRAAPEFYFDTYGGPAFSRALGGTIDFTHRFGDVFIGVSFFDQSVKNLTDAYSYLSGQQTRLALSSQLIRGAHTLSLSPYVGHAGFRDTDEMSSSYNVFGANFGYSLFVSPWLMSMLLGYEERRYPLAGADSFARRDGRWFEQLRVSYLLNSYVKFNVEADRTDNNSNFNTQGSDRTYRQTVILGGVSAGF